MGKSHPIEVFGYFINDDLGEKAEALFEEINKSIILKDHVDLEHVNIDGSKLEANAINIPGS